MGNAWRMTLTSRYPPTDTLKWPWWVSNKWHAGPVLLAKLDCLKLLQHVAECPLMSCQLAG